MSETTETEPLPPLRELVFRSGRPICPPCVSDWPGDRTAPLYWVAATDFELPVSASSAEFIVAVDRHYECYVNGSFVLRRRNFFNGDRYVFGQSWGRELVPHLRPGANRLQVVIRSDPWRNKNHRCFRPMLLVEGTIECGGSTVALASDANWQTAVVEDWRELISLAGCQTIPNELVRLPNRERAVLSGFAPDLVWAEAKPFALPEPCPRLLLWDDPPKRVDTTRPVRLVTAGCCRLIGAAVEFELAALQAR